MLIVPENSTQKPYVAIIKVLSLSHALVPPEKTRL